MTTDYWVSRGERYARQFRYNETFAEQERAFEKFLAETRPRTVLEFGCGFGRMTSIVRSINPERQVAVDISPHQIEEARKRVEGVTYVVSDILDFEGEEPFDLVFSAELLMHIHPDRVREAITKTIDLSRKWVLNIDLDNWKGSLASHNWLHQYRELYAPLVPTVVEIGSQAMFYVDKEEQ